MRLRSLRPLPPLALAALVACGGGGGGSSPAPQPPSTAPTISGVNPTHGSPGSAVTLTGTNLGGATAVTFNGRAAFAFTIAGATQINAVVPGGATSGPIQVATPSGSAASAPFTVDAALAPTLASFAPTALTSGTVVTLTGSHFVGATRVQFNGVDAAAFTVASDTQIQATAPAGVSAGALSVTTPGGTAVSGTTYTVDARVQVLLNTGFEQASPLAWQGDTGIIQSAPGSSSPSVVPHGGAKFAWLAGYGTAESDQITQDLYIPATAQSATATFYLKILTAEPGTTARDTCSVSVRTPAGAVLGTPLTLSNLDASEYAARSVDLLAYKGQTVRLTFTSQEDAQNATSFLLDDVTLQIGVPSTSDLRPVITSFTPTSGLAGETTVQITGGSFFGVTGVTVGGVNAAYTLTDGTRLSAVLAPSAPSGSAPITITNAQGTGSSASSFQVTLGQPTITALNPTQGPVGTPVILEGTYLNYPGTTLTLNGQPVTPTSQTISQILFSVPAGASSGNLVVTTPAGTVSRPFTVAPSGPTLDLRVARVQLTQSTQTTANSVPIVAGKTAFARIFVLANQTNTSTPSVQVTLKNGGVPVAGYPKTIPAPGASVPVTLDESALGASWNLAIPAGDLTTPGAGGYSLEAQVDPASLIAEADETNNLTTGTFAGTTVPAFKTTLFPVVLSSGTGAVSEATKNDWVGRLAKMYPVASVDVAVGSPFTGSVATLSSDGTGWSTLLNDLATKHQADGASDRYYYGALAVSYSSGVAGLGYVPNTPGSAFATRTAIGWDQTGRSDGGNYPEVFAHETGHNMGRHHSPCGSVASSDPNYPYAGGIIGAWGYDTVLGQLKSPTGFKDIMGYCTPNWVSDYVYQKILDFRGGSGGFLLVDAEDAPLAKGAADPRECLLVRGIVRADGRVDLLPAFRTRALPTPVPAAGEYTLALLDAQGRAVHAQPIDLMDLGCWPKGLDRHFVLALPLEAGVLDAVAGLDVLRDGQIKAGFRSPAPAARMVAAAPEVQRLAAGRIQLTWDAAVHPAALVRDADTGEVVAILSGGRQALETRGRRFDLVLSDGLSSRTHRLELPE